MALQAIPFAAQAVPRQPLPSARVRCSAHEGADRVVATELAGVPAILRIPARVSKPPIVLWHGFGPPQSEQALMQAFPLDDVPAVKVYLGLPFFGERAPAGGKDDLVRRQTEDVGLLVFEPVVVGAANELPLVVRELESAGCLRAGDKIGLFGFSAGGASALLSLTEHNAAIGSAVLLNPSTGLTASIEAYERATHRSYAWTPRSRALAARTDAAQHVADIAKETPPPAVLILEGGRDDLIGRDSVGRLSDALAPVYARGHASGRFQHRIVEGLAHNIDGSRSTDDLGNQIAAWFNDYL